MQVTNEQSLIVYFSQQCERYGFNIKSISSSSFPDAIIERNGVEYRTEFEYKSENFVKHKHDPDKADLVICWIHDWYNSPLPVLALQDANWGEDLWSDDYRAIYLYYKLKTIKYRNLIWGIATTLYITFIVLYLLAIYYQ